MSISSLHLQFSLSGLKWPIHIIIEWMDDSLPIEYLIALIQLMEFIDYELVRVAYNL